MPIIVTLDVMRFTSLEAVCAALDCQPGDLIEYRQNDEPLAPG